MGRAAHRRQGNERRVHGSVRVGIVFAPPCHGAAGADAKPHYDHATLVLVRVFVSQCYQDRYDFPQFDPKRLHQNR